MGRTISRVILSGAWLVGTAGLAGAQAPARPEADHLEVKYVRDSIEYPVLTRQVYRQATQAVQAVGPATGPARAWAVVLDVDETALDNSVYQLERAAYELPFDSESWNAWVRRGQAPAVPGVVEFVAAVRAAGGSVAWITNRDDVVREATRRNLAAVGLWDDNDRLCLMTSDPAYTKAVRRREVATGQGACAWPARPTEIVAFVGDQVGDFPAEGEDSPDAGRDAAFGTRFFLLPDPMYGNWTTKVTRDRR
jgi:5'-nucleotidase (lipoprotein e(P4) family)